MMADITVDEIKKLRAKTSAGMALCKEALTKSDGDMEKAIEYVNKRSSVVNRLSDATGAKIGLAKIALQDAEQDFEKAVEIIDERGWGRDIDKSELTREGIIGTYLHSVDCKTVALVEIFCETDFVAKNEKFQEFGKELAMQVVAMGAQYATRDDVPEDIVEQQKRVIEESDDLSGKPDNVVEKILEGKMNKFYEDMCLLEQKHFRDDSKKVSELLDEAAVSLGEAITIGRIYRMELGR